jgi:hypothetical protein
VVWFDEGPEYFKPFGAASMRLVSPHSRVPMLQAESSSGALVEGGGRRDRAEESDPRFLVTEAPGVAKTIRYPSLFAAAGCKGWEPSGAHVLAADELIVVGQCFWDDRFSRRPLFVRGLRGQDWHILRWIEGEDEPVIAAEGPLLAIGLQRPRLRMTVSIVNLHSGRVRANFTLPDGQLSFASPDRFVLYFPVPREPNELCFPLYRSQGCEHRIALYTIGGEEIADLGQAETAPLVSHMHLLMREHEGPPSDGERLSVRDLLGADTAPRLVVGFDSPARTLDAFAFRWPALAVVESTGIPRAPSEIHCWSGDYNPGKPYLQIFDLARPEPALPPPAIVEVEPSRPLTDCGPPPP